MKKRWVLILFALSLLFALMGTASAESSEVSISSAEVLYTLSPQEDTTYTLTTDIDLSSYTSWTGIDLDGVTFDGGGYSVTLPSGATSGLFDEIKGTSTVKDVTVTGSISTNADNVGGIANKVTGGATFTNCTNEANIVGGTRAGGIIGYADIDNANLTFEGCVNKGNISGTNVGGIIGDVDVDDSDTTDSDVYKLIIISYTENNITTATSNSGTISGSHAGGLVGHIDAAATITDATNSGTITGAHTGGLVACSDGAITITRSTNTGDVYATVDGSTTCCGGGILGYADGSLNVSDCTSTGDVTSDSVAGGVLGQSDASVTVSNTTVSGTITAPTAGGIVGGETESASTTTDGCTDNTNLGTQTNELTMTVDGDTATIAVVELVADTDYILPSGYLWTLKDESGTAVNAGTYQGGTTFYVSTPISYQFTGTAVAD